MSPRASSYDAIMDAAESVVIEAGASHLTLDAVAARAGVSKGGLLHHFPNKVSLLSAMIQRQIRFHNEMRMKILDSLPDGPARELKSFVLNVRHRDRVHSNLGASMSAAIAHDPRLNEPIRKIIKELYKKFASCGIPFEKAAVIALASDGLRFQEMLNVSPFSDKQREQVIQELVRLVDEATEEQPVGGRKKCLGKTGAGSKN